MPCACSCPWSEIDTRYKERPEGSVSKLNTYRDGFRILFTIVSLVREERPLIFFTSLFGFFAIFSLAFGIPVVIEYYQHAVWCRGCRTACWPPA